MRFTILLGQEPFIGVEDGGGVFLLPTILVRRGIVMKRLFACIALLVLGAPAMATGYHRQLIAAPQIVTGYNRAAAVAVNVAPAVGYGFTAPAVQQAVTDPGCASCVQQAVAPAVAPVTAAYTQQAVAPVVGGGCVQSAAFAAPAYSSRFVLRSTAGVYGNYASPVVVQRAFARPVVAVAPVCSAFVVNPVFRVRSGLGFRFGANRFLLRGF